jgi:hypothetical protein
MDLSKTPERGARTRRLLQRHSFMDRFRARVHRQSQLTGQRSHRHRTTWPLMNASNHKTGSALRFAHTAEQRAGQAATRPPVRSNGAVKAPTR